MSTQFVCDWCGRPASPRKYASWDGDELRFADPPLCDVCWLLLVAPGDVEDIWAEEPSAQRAFELFEDELARKAAARRNRPDARGT